MEAKSPQSVEFYEKQVSEQSQPTRIASITTTFCTVALLLVYSFTILVLLLQSGIFLKEQGAATNQVSKLSQSVQNLRKDPEHFNESPGSEISEGATAVQDKVFEALLNQTNQNVKILTQMAMVPVGQRKVARVSQTNISVPLTWSANFSCESADGEALSSCLWTRPVKGQTQVVIIDAQVFQDTGRTTNVDGISFFGDELADGKCLVEIESVNETDIGSWSCTLLGQSGAVYSGEVLVTKQERPPSIYCSMATWGHGGVTEISLKGSELSRVTIGEGRYGGVAFDPTRKEVYWSQGHRINRANRTEGAKEDLVTRSFNHTSIQVLAFDWIADNIYIGSDAYFNGKILACDSLRLTETLSCASIFKGEGFNTQGIVLNPVEGVMYWIQIQGLFKDGEVVRAEMDGSNRVTIVSGLVRPIAIALDFQAARLYWVDYNTYKIQSSSVDGSDLRTVIDFSNDARLNGIAVYNHRIYWSNSVSLQSSKMDGQDVRTLYTGEFVLVSLAIEPSKMERPTNRTNHCKDQKCDDGVCVLTAISFRCLPRTIA